MEQADLPPALRSPWARFVLHNRARGFWSVDVERRWANDLLPLGMDSDAVVALVILRDEEWQEAPSLVDAILRELSVDPTDTAGLYELIRRQIALAIESGADPVAEIREGMRLASRAQDVPGYDGALDIFYWLDDQFDLVTSGILSDRELQTLGPKAWALKHLREKA